MLATTTPSHDATPTPLTCRAGLHTYESICSHSDKEPSSSSRALPPVNQYTQYPNTFLLS